MSKTQDAVAMVMAGTSIRQAARELDVSEQAIRREIKRQDSERAGICPCCGKPLAQADRLSQAVTALENSIAAGQKLDVPTVLAYLRKLV